MEAIQDFYDGARDAYDKVYPWIPASFKNSVSTFLAQLLLILQTAFNNPSELPTLAPSIISTLFMAMSIYWTVTSAYHTARRGFRILWFLTKYGSIVALGLGALGWIKPDSEFNGHGPEDGADLTVGRAILSGWHTLMEYFNDTGAESPNRRTNQNIWSSIFSSPTRTNPRTKSKSSTKRRKPWEKFDIPLPNDSPPSSNTRSKSSSKPKKPARGAEDNNDESSSPLFGLSPMDLLNLGFNTGGDRLSALASALGLKDNNREAEEDEETPFERAIREAWEKAIRSDVYTAESDGMADGTESR